jgi:hypothetical protein
MRIHVPAAALRGGASAGGRREEGAILIIAIGVLTLLARLGATFANLMRLEKQATQNYIDSQEVDLINDSALEQVIADLRGAENWRSFTPYKAPWLYKLLKVDDLAQGLEPIESDNVGHWEVLQRKQKTSYRYKTKVIDTSAQININGKQDTLIHMIDNLGHAIAASSRLRSHINPLWSGPNQSGNPVKGLQIVEFRNKLEGHRFRSKTQLRELIGHENFEIIKDFITVESYVDPYTYKPDDGTEEVIEFGQLQSGQGLGGANRGTGVDTFESPAEKISPEPRSPININTASEEVLITCLQGIGARRPFPYSHLTYAGIDQGATLLGQPVPGKEEKDNVTPRGVWIYSDVTGQGLDYDKAHALAQRIIVQRKQTPFLTWSTGDASLTGGFAEFINGLPDSFFPPHERAVVVDPRIPGGDGRINAEILHGSSPEMTRMWTKGHDSQERSFRKQAGLPVQTQYAFFYEMMKGAIIANANPNSRINRYNPNAPNFVPVDKSDLVRLDKNRRTLRKAYTTEFCFDTNGVYEVTTLGQIAEESPAEGSKGPSFRPIYQKPMRTVVKVFDTLRHTNQFHFEKTFASGQRSSRANRRNVMTFPEPMTALTEAMSSGSLRDGSIQLAGQNDARRLLAPAASRFQLYRVPESIAMALGFQDRDETSFAQLRRMNNVGVSPQLNDELLKVLWAPWSRHGTLFREIYSRKELTAGGLGILNQSAMNFEPRVQKEVIATDLYPDGFHQSLYTSGHLGARLVHLPAHQRMGKGVKTGRGVQVGAGNRVNLTGNVPYYEGGLAFWVKFEFDGDDPVFSGLVGCTQVIEDVGQEPKDSEGTQFYIFKNTEGYLRIVRMYYHQAFPDSTGGSEGGGTEAAGGAVVLWPPVGSGQEQGGGEGNSPGGQNPIIDKLDLKKKVVRSDFLIDVRKFRAHEWHHIAYDWNDQVASSYAQVQIDFQRVQDGGPHLRHNISDKPTYWVRLNCKRPRDELFIGGFIRAQGVSDSGVFKWFTNIASAGSGGGIQIVEPTVKKVIANATIDEFITYEGSFQGVRSFYGTGGAQGYFTRQNGTYANVFEVPLPPEIDYVTLRSFDWTGYYPSFFTTRDGQRHKIITPSMKCTIFPGRENVAPFDEPWRPARRTTTNPVANKRLLRRESKGLLGINADLVYEFNISPGKVTSGSLAGGSVQTPVIDDVTMTYFLPDPKILLQEEAEEPAVLADTKVR